MQRREFLIGSGAAFLGATVSEPLLAQTIRLPVPPQRGLSILQGLTTQTTTQLSVDVPRQLQTAYELLDVATNKRFSPTKIRTVKKNSSKIRVDTVRFADLELGHKYKFTVKNKRNNVVLDERFLSTVDLEKKRARIALMSCMNDILPAKNRTWPKAQAADLDYLFFLGDNVYGDLPFVSNPEFLWWRYVMTRQNIPYYHWKNLKPVLAVWDDHDFGKDNSDGHYRHKKETLEIFKGFFAQMPEEDVFSEGPGNSSFFRAFDHNFAFLDARYFRGLPGELSNRGFLGSEQLQWLNEEVAASEKPTWLMQGSPVFGRQAKGSSYQHSSPDEFEHYLAMLKSWNVPVSFASGDLHYSEVSEVDRRFLGMKAHEVVSSCMHSKTRENTYDNPNRHLAGTLEENFVILEKTSAKGFNWRATCVSARTKLLPRETLTV